MKIALYVVIYVVASLGYIIGSATYTSSSDVVAVPPVVPQPIEVTTTTTTTVPVPTTTTTVPAPTTTTTTHPSPTTTTTRPKPTTTTTTAPKATWNIVGNRNDPRLTQAVARAAVDADRKGYDVCGQITLNLLDSGFDYALALKPECLIEVSHYSPSPQALLDSWMAHEVSHLVAPSDAAHGPEFLTICRDLVRDSHESAFCVTPGVVETAEMFVGTSKDELGFSDFWCAEFVELVLWQTGRTVDNPLYSPSRLMYELEPVSNPEPGVVVGITYQGHQVDHVAIVVEVLPNGVRVIEGNGSNETADRVGYNFWSYDQVMSYGR